MPTAFFAWMPASWSSREVFQPASLQLSFSQTLLEAVDQRVQIVSRKAVIIIAAQAACRDGVARVAERPNGLGGIAFAVAEACHLEALDVLGPRVRVLVVIARDVAVLRDGTRPFANGHLDSGKLADCFRDAVHATIGSDVDLAEADGCVFGDVEGVEPCALGGCLSAFNIRPGIGHARLLACR